VGDAPSAPAFLLVEGQHLFLHLRWGAARAVVGTARSIHQACFTLLPIAFHPLADGVAGDGEPSGGLPEAAALFQEGFER